MDAENHSLTEDTVRGVTSPQKPPSRNSDQGYRDHHHTDSREAPSMRGRGDSKGLGTSLTDPLYLADLDKLLSCGGSELVSA